jgi:hypothetical protein
VGEVSLRSYSFLPEPCVEIISYRSTKVSSILSSEDNTLYTCSPSPGNKRTWLRTFVEEHIGRHTCPSFHCSSLSQVLRHGLINWGFNLWSRFPLPLFMGIEVLQTKPMILYHGRSERHGRLGLSCIGGYHAPSGTSLYLSPSKLSSPRPFFAVKNSCPTAEKMRSRSLVEESLRFSLSSSSLHAKKEMFVVRHKL